MEKAITTEEYLAQYIDKESLIYKILKATYYSFCYPDFKRLNSKIAKATMKKILLNGLRAGLDIVKIRGGITTIIETLRSECIANNVKIITNSDITFTCVNEVKIISNKKYIDYDHLVVATQFPYELFSEKEVESNITYTKCHVLLIKVRNFPVDGNLNWNSIIYEILNVESQTVFIYKTIDNFDFCYIQIYIMTEQKLNFNDIKSEINNILSEFKSTEYHIISEVYWDKVMPILQNKHIELIDSFKNKDVSLIGDYQGFPSIENSIYQANRVVKYLLNK